MEENKSDVPMDSMEGYLQKRVQTGLVKSLKRKWYVLKNGELRCYQNEDACKKNAEMYQDAVQVNHIQTVRTANENHGVEVVTQHKKFILVASSEEDQKKWIKAIYEALKDNRPRSVSFPTDKTSPTRKISASKFGLPRMLTFNRKSLDETQNETQSQFYVHQVTANKPSQSRSEVGVQADVQVDIQADIKADVQADVQIPQSKTPAEVGLNTECQATTVLKTENADTDRHSVTKGSHLMDEPDQGGSSCECKPKETTDNSIVLKGQVESNDAPRSKPCPDEQAEFDEALMKQHEVSYENGDITREEMTAAGKSEQSDSLDDYGQDPVDTLVQTTGSFSLAEPLHEKETLEDEDKEKVGGATKEKSILELQALLKSLSEGRFSDCDEVFSSDDESIPLVSDDDESETTQKGKSAFEQLQELLEG